MHTTHLLRAGVAIAEAKKVLIMIHGRGGSAEDILSIAGYLNLPGYALIAPQATGNSWYPYSFLAPTAQNEPGLSSAITRIHDVVNDTIATGITAENIYFLGFSQGACLTLEYTARNARKYGGTIAFTGGLIGEKIDNNRYMGNFQQTPVFIGSSNPDPHVPVERVQASSKLLIDMGADVVLKIYDNMGHTVSQDEIAEANRIFAGKAVKAPGLQ